MKLLSHVRLSATPWTVAYQAPLSTGVSRQDYWSGVPFQNKPTSRCWSEHKPQSCEASEKDAHHRHPQQPLCRERPRAGASLGRRADGQRRGEPGRGLLYNLPLSSCRRTSGGSGGAHGEALHPTCARFSFQKSTRPRHPVPGVS